MSYCYYNQVIQINIIKPINDNVKTCFLKTKSSLCSIKASYTNAVGLGMAIIKDEAGAVRFCIYIFLQVFFSPWCMVEKSKVEIVKDALWMWSMQERYHGTPSQDFVLHITMDV